MAIKITISSNGTLQPVDKPKLGAVYKGAISGDLLVVISAAPIRIRQTFEAWPMLCLSDGAFRYAPTNAFGDTLIPASHVLATVEVTS